MKTKIVVWLMMIVMTQSFCLFSAPIRRIPAKKSDVKVEVIRIPEKVSRGENASFVLKTVSKNQCMGAVIYQDSGESKWITVNLPELEAGADGLCEWLWNVPLEASLGDAEFRGAVAQNGEHGYTGPKIFCIEKCSWELPASPP